MPCALCGQWATRWCWCHSTSYEKEWHHFQPDQEEPGGYWILVCKPSCGVNVVQEWCRLSEWVLRHRWESPTFLTWFRKRVDEVMAELRGACIRVQTLNDAEASAKRSGVRRPQRRLLLPLPCLGAQISPHTPPQRSLKQSGERLQKAAAEAAAAFALSRAAPSGQARDQAGAEGRQTSPQRAGASAGGGDAAAASASSRATPSGQAGDQAGAEGRQASPHRASASAGGSEALATVRCIDRVV